IECVAAQITSQRQKDCRSQDLSCLNSLQCKTRIPAAPPEGGVLEDHRTGPGDLSGNRKSLDQTKGDEKRRRKPADLPVSRQQTDSHCREPHEKHTEQENVLATVCVAPMSENEGSDRTSDVADAVSCE